MRKARIKFPHMIYHVSAKANRSEFIFQHKKMKLIFINILKRAMKKYKFTLHNFCIMNNHIHLMIQPREKEDLSRIMQWILSVFATTFNRINNLKGHVWYDRFKSKIIWTLKQYLNTFIYIANNPVKAGLIKKNELYPFSGLTYIRQNKSDLVKPPQFIRNLLLFPESGL